MKSIIVGTAGHIDHGKTALVRALTGIDADRLQEEKRRGITIDLGFAHMELRTPAGEALRLGFVDVPGHERFVRNMLAGVGGIDLVLLVIAADESIKPQTREHFDILQLLGVRRGITVLTKSDAVDAETLDVVRLEVEEFLRGTFLDAPNSIIPVSSLTGAGLDELKQAIIAAAAGTQLRDALALPRLPIDRVFTMKGFGTVVTGTLISGTIRKEDELEVFPAGRRVRVRGIQVHGSSSDQALAGQRTALNLAGASTEDLERGMTLAPPDTLQATQRVDVQLQLLHSAPRPLKDRARVHFHAHTTETVAQAALYGAKEIRPGETSFARLSFADPILLLPQDRFILRQFSPVITIGGGAVIDSAPLARARTKSNALEVLAGDNAEQVLKHRIARRDRRGISLAQLVAESGWPQSRMQSQLAEPLKQKQIIAWNDTLIDASAWNALQTQLIQNVAAFHTKNPLVPGISREELREQLDTTPAMFDALMRDLPQQKKIEIAGDLVRLPGRGVVMKDEEAESKKTIEEAFAAAGLKAPALHDVLAGLKVDKARAQKIVTLLLRDRILVKVSQELVVHRSALEQLRRQLAAYKAKSPKINVGEFKDLTGVSRKYAIPLLEYLDRERVTQRTGDVRTIL